MGWFDAPLIHGDLAILNAVLCTMHAYKVPLVGTVLPSTVFLPFFCADFLERHPLPLLILSQHNINMMYLLHFVLAALAVTGGEPCILLIRRSPS